MYYSLTDIWLLQQNLQLHIELYIFPFAMQFFPQNSPRIKNYLFIEIVSDFGLLYAKSLLKYYYSINTIFPFFKLYEALFFSFRRKQEIFLFLHMNLKE